ncbi:MAG: RluA family pseudouridine synthase, partial [Ureaplasma sp.]|nr:RluA family pseudouridine synthase [Ureaplasma sp.]
YNIIVIIIVREYMKTIIIKQNDINKRIDNFLSKLFQNLKKSEIYKLLRNKKIKVNDKKVNFDYRLMMNDKIKIFLDIESEKSISRHKLWKQADSDIKVVYEDKNIIIVNKPVGLMVYDEKQKTVNTLINKIIKYLYENNEYNDESENSFIPSLAHRIDTNTSGIIIAAKNSESLKELNEIFKEKLIKKTYLTLVYGIVEHKHREINCFIRKSNKNIVDASFDKKNSQFKEAVTKYKLLNTFSNKYSLLEVDLITGRTHQIRATFNLINHPLVGEKKYIKSFINKDSRFKHQCLVSHKIKFFELNTGILNYLSNKEFKVNDIWFLDLLNSKH